MKNQKTQFKAIAPRCKNIGLLLACLAAVFISAPTPAEANDQDDEETIRSKALSRGPYLRTSARRCPALAVASLALPSPIPGTANVLGAFTGSANFVPNLCDGSYTGTFNWAAANGDRISGTFLGQNIPTATAGVFYNVETAVITGGTGRFRHATGMFTLYGQINFVTGTFVLPWSGTISIGPALGQRDSALICASQLAFV